MSVTALTLVNRVLRMARVQQDVTSLSDPEELVVLDLVNDAIGIVLNVEKHPFDVRHDGMLLTEAVRTSDSVGSNMSVTNGQKTMSTVGTAAPYVGNFVTRVIVTDDGSYGSTSFRVDSAATSGALAVFTISVPFPGTTNTVVGAEWKTVVYEYILPATVRSMLRIRDEQGELDLTEIDAEAQFETLVPRPHDRQGPPRYAAVGGTDISTYTGTAKPEPRLRMVVWPIPTASAVLAYSYYYKHPLLTTASSTLVGVPDEIVAEVVHEAHGLYTGSIDRDIDSGTKLQAASLQRLQALRRESGTSPARRRIIHAWGKGGVNRRSWADGFTDQTLGQ